WIVSGREKSSPAPEGGSLVIDRVDHERAAADEAGCMSAALECMFQEASTDPAPDPVDIGRKLAEQQAGNRIWWLAGTDRAWQHVRNDGRRRKTIVSDDAANFMNDQDGRKTLLLIGKGAGPEPMVQRRLSAAEFRNVVSRSERLGRRDRHGLALGCIVRFPRGRTLCHFHHFGHRLSRTG